MQRFGEDGRQDPESAARLWSGYLDMFDRAKLRPLVDSKTYNGIDDVPKALDDLSEKRLLGKAVISVYEGEKSKL